jgi:hypothetical protein
VARVIAYVDGFNLYHGLHDRFRHKYLWLDLLKLVTRLRRNDTIVAVRYFTAPVLNDPGAQSRQQIYLNALTAHCGSTLEIVQGRYQSKQRSCRRCGATWTAYEEKETDVNIAVRLVADTAINAMDIALIISADSDLCPAIRTARDVASGTGTRLGVIAAFPPGRNSNELRTLVPATFPIGQAHIRNSLLPNLVTDTSNGRKYQRPQKWT